MVGDEGDAEPFADLLGRLKPDATIADLRDGTSFEDMTAWKQAGSGTLAVIDDGADRRRAADLAFYPPVPQVKELAWDNSTTKVLAGWEWVILGIDARRTDEPEPGAKVRVIVTMGGSDPFGLTERALDALAPLADNIDIRVVIGKGRQDPDGLAAFAMQRLPNATLIRDAENLAPHFAEADLALCSFGVSSYEAAMMRCPPVIIALDDDAARSASALHDAGAAVLLGDRHAVNEDDIRSAVPDLAEDDRRRQSMAAIGQDLLDGNGAARVAEAVIHAVNRR